MDEKIKTLATKEELKTLPTKAELKTEQDKIVKLETHDLSYFLGHFFGGGGGVGVGESGGGGDDGSQNMFFYQPTFIALELKINKSTKYFIVWTSKGLYKSKLLPLYGALLPNIKYFVPNIAIQFSNTLLVVEQNS